MLMKHFENSTHLKQRDSAEILNYVGSIVISHVILMLVLVCETFNT